MGACCVRALAVCTFECSYAVFVTVFAATSEAGILVRAYCLCVSNLLTLGTLYDFFVYGVFKSTERQLEFVLKEGLHGLLRFDFDCHVPSWFGEDFRVVELNVALMLFAFGFGKLMPDVNASSGHLLLYHCLCELLVC